MILWGLQTSQFADSEGFIPHALSRRRDLSIRKVCVVHYVGSVVGILANQDGSRGHGKDNASYQERSV